MQNWGWFRLAQGLSLLFGGMLIVGTLSWWLADLPGGEDVIYPLHRLAYLIGDYGHVPSGIVLSFAIITIWPLIVIWAMAHGGSVVPGRSPRIRPWLMLCAVTTLAFGVFRTVESPQILDSASNSTHSYILSAREHPLDPTEFFLYECDRRQIICREILPPEAVNRSWSTRLQLDVTEARVRLLNMQTSVFSHEVSTEG